MAMRGYVVEEIKEAPRVQCARRIPTAAGPVDTAPHLFRYGGEHLDQEIKRNGLDSCLLQHTVTQRRYDSTIAANQEGAGARNR